jgi:regulator of replication initiation timing
VSTLAQQLRDFPTEEDCGDPACKDCEFGRLCRSLADRVEALAASEQALRGRAAEYHRRAQQAEATAENKWRAENMTLRKALDDGAKVSAELLLENGTLRKRVGELERENAALDQRCDNLETIPSIIHDVLWSKDRRGSDVVALAKAVVTENSTLRTRLAALAASEQSLRKRVGELERENSEAYDNLVAMLRSRFPVNPDGSLPDFAIEDVLTENATLRTRLAAAERVVEAARAVYEADDAFTGSVESPGTVKRDSDLCGALEIYDATLPPSTPAHSDGSEESK